MPRATNATTVLTALNVAQTVPQKPAAMPAQGSFAALLNRAADRTARDAATPLGQPFSRIVKADAKQPPAPPKPSPSAQTQTAATADAAGANTLDDENAATAGLPQPPSGAMLETVAGGAKPQIKDGSRKSCENAESDDQDPTDDSAATTAQPTVVPFQAPASQLPLPSALAQTSAHIAGSVPQDTQDGDAAPQASDKAAGISDTAAAGMPPAPAQPQPTTMDVSPPTPPQPAIPAAASASPIGKASTDGLSQLTAPATEPRVPPEAISATAGELTPPPPTAVPVTTPTATATSDTGRALALRISRSARAGEDTLTIELHPADLGHVAVRLAFHDGSVDVQMTFNRHEAYQAMSQDRVALEQQLSQVGIDLGSGGLDLRYAHAGTAEPTTGGTGTASTPTASDETMPDTIEHRAVLTDGLVNIFA